VLVSGVAGCNAYRLWQALREAGVPYFVFAPRYLGFLQGFPREWAKIKQRLCWPWAGYPLFRDAHAVFFSSEEAKREVRACFWPYDCHEFVLTCGVAVDVPNQNQHDVAGFFGGHPELVGKRIFSVLAPRVDLIPDELLRAVRTLMETGLWDCGSMRLVLAGFDDAKVVEALRVTVKRYGLDGIVHAVGTLDYAARRDLLKVSEALVQPARAENSGQAVAEAFAAGKPVLIARGLNLWREVLAHLAGLAEDDTDAGYVALFGNWLRESPEEHATLGANARLAYETHYIEQAAANTLTAVIYLLIGARQVRQQPIDPDIFRNEVDFL
jgi:glycosyltransferase involved in cell wall biosynthesis